MTEIFLDADPAHKEDVSKFLQLETYLPVLAVALPLVAVWTLWHFWAKVWPMTPLTFFVLLFVVMAAIGGGGCIAMLFPKRKQR